MTGKLLLLNLGFLCIFSQAVFCDDNIVSESVKGVGNLVVETTKAVGNVLDTTVKTFNPDDGTGEGNKGYIIKSSDADEYSKKITQDITESEFSSQKYRGKLTTGAYTGK
ncbi:MAG: hypothetical protein PHO00_04115 [bacterium]|nr:hypothetical protein [bacterium]